MREVGFSAASNVNTVINHIEMYTESISEYYSFAIFKRSASNKMLALPTLYDFL